MSRTVPVSQAKARLSEYLRQVRGGEEVVITERGRPIARLVPVADREPHLADLERRGLLRVADAELADDFLAKKRPKATGGSVLDALLEERREGR